MSPAVTLAFDLKMKRGYVLPKANTHVKTIGECVLKLLVGNHFVTTTRTTMTTRTTTTTDKVPLCVYHATNATQLGMI